MSVDVDSKYENERLSSLFEMISHSYILEDDLCGHD